MTAMLSFVFEKDLEGLTNFLLQHLDELERSGVVCSAMASNTPHIVFDQLRDRTGLQLISIVEETCKTIKSQALQTVGLFGTRSTMEAGFYQANAEKHGFKIVIPNDEEMAFIHAKYFEELVFNQINPDTKTELLAIADALQAKNGIEGLILGGTELSLILDQSDFKELKLFDTTLIHVDSIVSEMISYA